MEGVNKTENGYEAKVKLLELDTDKDGKPSVKLSLVAEADDKEALDEVTQKLKGALGSDNEWIKNLLGLK